MKLNSRFEATLQKSPAKGGWTCVVMDDSAEFFGTRGLVKVRGTIEERLADQSPELAYERAVIRSPPLTVAPSAA